MTKKQNSATVVYHNFAISPKFESQNFPKLVRILANNPYKTFFKILKSIPKSPKSHQNWLKSPKFSKIKILKTTKSSIPWSTPHTIHCSIPYWGSTAHDLFCTESTAGYHHNSFPFLRCNENVPASSTASIVSLQDWCSFLQGGRGIWLGLAFKVFTNRCAILRVCAAGLAVFANLTIFVGTAKALAGEA